MTPDAKSDSEREHDRESGNWDQSHVEPQPTGLPIDEVEKLCP